MAARQINRICVCSQISGLTSALNAAFPNIDLLELTGQELTHPKTEVGPEAGSSAPKTDLLISDNDKVAQILYKNPNRFAFIQVNKIDYNSS